MEAQANNPTPRANILILLSKLATEIARAEEQKYMYAEAWNADDFLNAVQVISEQLMNEASKLPEDIHTIAADNGSLFGAHCPFCGAHDFVVRGIVGHSVTRKCNKCLHLWRRCE